LHVSANVTSRWDFRRKCRCPWRYIFDLCGVPKLHSKYFIS